MPPLPLMAVFDGLPDPRRDTENKLHRLFHWRRVNRVNERKEFFHVTIGEISDAVRANHGAIELTQAAEAEEFRKTLAILQDEIARQADQRSFAIGRRLPDRIWPAPLTPTNYLTCSSQLIGSGRSSLSSTSAWFARPSRITSTMSGASNAGRSIRLT